MVIPAYNEERYIAQAVESALNQSFPPNEILVVDDGSTDGTLEALSSFGDHVTIVQQQNGGLAAARNAAILRARSDWVAFLDADDRWAPDYLQTASHVIQTDAETQILFGTAALVSELGADVGISIVPFDGCYEDLRTTLLRFNPFVPSSCVIRTDVLRWADGFTDDPGVVEDWDLWLRLAGQVRVRGEPRMRIFYRVHSNSISSDVAVLGRAVIRMMRRHVGAVIPGSGSAEAEARRGWGGAFRFCAISALSRAGDWSLCAAFLRAALIVDPSLLEDDALFYEIAQGAWSTAPSQESMPSRFKRTEHGIDGMIGKDLQPQGGMTRALSEGASSALRLALARVAYHRGLHADSRRLALLVLGRQANPRMRRTAAALCMRTTVGRPFIALRREMAGRSP